MTRKKVLNGKAQAMSFRLSEENYVFITRYAFENRVSLSYAVNKLVGMLAKGEIELEYGEEEE